jgi:hypothetical protein
VEKESEITFGVLLAYWCLNGAIRLAMEKESVIQGRSQSWSYTFVTYHHITWVVFKAMKSDKIIKIPGKNLVDPQGHLDTGR